LIFMCTEQQLLDIVAKKYICKKS